MDYATGRKADSVRRVCLPGDYPLPHFRRTLPSVCNVLSRIAEMKNPQPKSIAPLIALAAEEGAHHGGNAQAETFWIGAVGSRRTHQLRCEALTANGARRDQIASLQGPIGLIPRTRDASMLAVSTLAEIASAYKDLTA